MLKWLPLLATLKVLRKKCEVRTAIRVLRVRLTGASPMNEW